LTLWNGYPFKIRKFNEKIADDFKEAEDGSTDE
jgi:hypothetical protein